VLNIFEEVREMAKTKKTRKTVVDLDDFTDSTVDEGEDVVVEKKKVVEKSGPTHFIAILQKATTYNLAGHVFMRNDPVEVPIAHLKVFKENGWFLVNQLR
jgi:hypothetical protein